MNNFLFFILFLIVSQNAAAFSAHASRQTLDYMGHLEPQHQTLLYSPAKSSIVSIKMSYGATVKKGEVWLTLSAPELESRCRAATATRLETEQRWHAATHWQSQLSVVAMKNQLVRAKARLKRAEERARQTQKLFDKGIVSQEERDNDQHAFEDAHQAMEEARLSLSDAEAQYRGNAESVIQLQYENAKQEEEQCLMQKERLSVIAPFDGILMPPPKSQGAPLVLSEGVMLQDEQPIGIIAEEGQYQVRFGVDEKDRVQLKLGDKVVVHLEAFPDIELQGSLVEVGKHPIEVSGGWIHYECRVILMDIPEKVKKIMQYGMLVTLRVEVSPHAD